MFSKLIYHFTNYSFGNLLVLIAGLLSFSLLTRLLPVDQYGLLSLVSTTITLLVACGKVGLQHASVRFYSDSLREDSPYDFKTFSSTALISMCGIAFCIIIVWLLVVYFGFELISSDQQIKFLFMLIAPLVILQVLKSAFLSIANAKEMSRLVSKISVIERYAVLLLVATTLLTISPKVEWVFAAQIVTSLFLSAFLLKKFYHAWEVNPKHYDSKLLKSMLLYGLPMLGYELAGTILNIGDRYVIKILLGAESLGIYSANYTIAEYGKLVVFAALGRAVLPMYLRMYAEEGEEKTRAFIAQSLHIYCLIGFMLVAGLSGMGQAVVSLLATPTYASGAHIIPYVICGMILHNANNLYAPGLHIKKQSLLHMLLILIMAIFNIGANFLLIPHMNIEGAALATTLSSIGLAILYFLAGRRFFSVQLPVLKIGKVVFAAILMYFTIIKFPLVANDADTVIIKVTYMAIQGISGVIVYGTTLLCIDKSVREWGHLLFKKAFKQ